jgi:hypothetical protein
MQTDCKERGQLGHKAEERNLKVSAIECTAMLIIDCELPQEVSSKGKSVVKVADFHSIFLKYKGILVQ